MREKVAGAGALVGAILASACCWLPLLLITVGAGGAVGIASMLEAYRVPFAILAFTAIGSAWYLTYRKPKTGMSVAHTVPVASSETPACPCCGKTGKKVPSRTVSALAKRPVRPGQYFLCLAPECALVYYGPTALMKDDLNVYVGFKEAQAPHLVCYCFEHSIEEIEEELRRTGTTTIPDSIKSKIRAGQCACEVKNPQGTCCLGNVNRAVSEARERIAGRAAGPVGGPAVQCTPAPQVEESHDTCCRLPAGEDGAESCCAPSGAGTKVRLLNKVMLWILTPLILALTLFPHQIFALFASTSPQPPAPAVLTEGEERLVLRIEGMT